MDPDDSFHRFKKAFFLNPLDYRFDVNLYGEMRLRDKPFKRVWATTPEEWRYLKIYEEWKRTHKPEDIKPQVREWIKAPELDNPKPTYEYVPKENDDLDENDLR